MLEPRSLDLKGEFSDVLFITGLLCKGRSDDDMWNFLSTVETTFIETEQETNAPGGGKVWARCDSIDAAKKAQALLHQQSYKGCTIMCRFELGFDPVSGKRRVSRNSIHTTCIRRVQQRRGDGNNKNREIVSEPISVNYSYKSLSIGELEYPFPSGMYLSRLISLVQKWPNRMNDPLVELVANNYLPPGNKSKMARSGGVFGNRYAKEITESMAMVDAVERAMKLCLGRSTLSFSNNEDLCVRVYCVGDGKYPVTAATMALNYPHPGWEFISIDPLLQPLNINADPGNYQHHQLIQVAGKSEDYQLPPLPTPSQPGDDGDVQYVDIVVACHSHAPLQEFWDRILKRNANSIGSCRAIAIAMACCANYSDLNQSPTFEFDDYEVYSPKRRVIIYSDYLSCSST
eukprot:scaffold1034_cov127-Cylindrotheca_fusiformis.AAC.7